MFLNSVDFVESSFDVHAKKNNCASFFLTYIVSSFCVALFSSHFFPTDFYVVLIFLGLTTFAFSSIILTMDEKIFKILVQEFNFHFKIVNIIPACAFLYVT